MVVFTILLVAILIYMVVDSRMKLTFKQKEQERLTGEIQNLNVEIKNLKKKADLRPKPSPRYSTSRSAIPTRREDSNQEYYERLNRTRDDDSDIIAAAVIASAMVDSSDTHSNIKSSYDSSDSYSNSYSSSSYDSNSSSSYSSDSSSSSSYD